MAMNASVSLFRKHFLYGRQVTKTRCFFWLMSSKSILAAFFFDLEAPVAPGKVETKTDELPAPAEVEAWF